MSPELSLNCSHTLRATRPFFLIKAGGSIEEDAMNRKMLGVGAVVGVGVFLAAGWAGAQEFSADMVSRTGKEIVNAKIYVAKDKVRMEMPESVMIIRRDKNLTWMLMPVDKMYMEQLVNMSSAPKVAKEFEGETERVAMGAEPVDGASADKFKVTYKIGRT